MSTDGPPEKSGGKPPLALIAGPTASGKSDLAVKLGQALEEQGVRGVVINADSAQVYSDLQVLSARPTEEEMGGIEHRLFGAWDGSQACSAADWAEAAKREIADIHADDGVPILVGGTGLYMRTLLEGIAPVPGIQENIRQDVRAMSTEDVRSALECEDPGAAARLAPKDTSRMMRALEVVRSSGKTLSEWQKQKVGGIGTDVELHPLVILPDREWLYERCDRRFELMLDGGAIAEVEALLARSLDPGLPVMRAIGVPEISSMLKGELSRPEAIAASQTATRRYAKRQYTWFKNQMPVDWQREGNISECLPRDFILLLHKQA